MHLLIRWVINAVALMILPYLIPTIHVRGFLSAFIAALFIALVNTVIRPIALLLTLPINVLTLGLFTFVLNALLFWAVSTMVGGFYVEGFWAAFFGALLYSILSYLIGAVIFHRAKTRGK